MFMLGYISYMNDVKIVFQRCNSTLNAKQTCANQSEIDEFYSLPGNTVQLNFT